MRPKKRTVVDLQRQAEQMVRDGTMPPLEDVLRAVAKVREKYRQAILDSRHGQKNGKTPDRRPNG